jgi:integrase
MTAPVSAAHRRPTRHPTVAISNAVAAMLTCHLDRFVAPEPDTLVFTNAAGQPLSHSSFQTHHFKRAQLAAAGSCWFHDLRPTSVALAIAEGAHPKAIQVRIGHGSITVTLDPTVTSFQSSTKRSPPSST